MKITDVTADDFFLRSDLINYLVSLYNYKSYLEIGVDTGSNFERVDCHYKVGVDPAKKYDKLTHNITSDEFFSMNTEKFDIIFIDGLHLSEQVIIDIKNSLEVLNDKGTIVMHDCLPVCEEAQFRERTQSHWNGDVWKAFAFYRKNPDLIMFTLVADQGLGFIKKGKQETFEVPDNLDFTFYKNNIEQLMKFMSAQASLEAIKILHQKGY